MLFSNKKYLTPLIKLYSLAILFASGITITHAQITKVMGVVTDFETKEPMPFVNVIFKGTTIGSTTDFDGNYSLQIKNTPTKPDSLVVTFLGYQQLTKAVKKNSFQTIDFQMKSNTINLEEVVIMPGENPAVLIMKKVWARRDDNNRNKYDAYQFEVYNKIEFDINNIDSSFMKKKVFEPFKFVFNNLDTSIENGKIYLPVLLSETTSDQYFRKRPKVKKEIIKATRISGVENKSISQFIGNMYVDINVYDNYNTLFDKSFVCPVGNVGLAFYRYYLTDSAYIGNQWCYKIMFKPRRKQELTYTGNMWIHDSTFTVKTIEMKIPNEANINYIRDLMVKQEFDVVDGKNWMLTKENIVVDFNPMNDKVTGFFGRRTVCYKDIILNKLLDDKFYGDGNAVIINDDADQKDDTFWKTARQDSLNKNEQAIYTMVDSVKDLPVFKTWVDVLQMFVTGYRVWRDFEFGPYFTTLSFNDFEGGRIRLGGRTSNDFSKRMMLDGYVAIGTKDQRFKYGGGFIYLIEKNPRQSISTSYKYDMEQLGQSINAFRTDNIFSSAFSRGPSNKLSMVEQIKTSYEKEWFTGFSNVITFSHRNVYPQSATPFEVYEKGFLLRKRTLTTSEITFSTHFAYREAFFFGEFDRVSVGTKYPIFEIDYSYGIPNFWNGDFEYHRLAFRVKQWFNINPIGWSRYSIEAGKIFGKLPFPLLKLHEGNETYYWDESAFNMMNYFEFVSDEYCSFYYTHHFDGLLFNKIPLFRKLKLREVGQFKGVVGSLQNKNTEVMPFPETLYGLKKPYMEAGIGIENIVKVFRIDAMWRLSYLDHPNIAKFGIRFSFQFSF